MKHINTLLSSDEHIEYDTKVSTVSFVWLFVLGGFVFLWGTVDLFITHNPFILIVGVLCTSYPIIPLWGNEIVITNKRLIHHHGLIKPKTTIMAFKDINSIQIKQNLLGKFLNYGTVIVIETTGKKANLKGIENPFDFKDTLVAKVESDLKLE